MSNLTLISLQPQSRTCTPDSLDRPHHGVPGHDLAVHSWYAKHSTYSAGQVPNSYASTTRNQPPPSNLSRTTSFCNCSISTWLPYEPPSASTTANMDDHGQPTLDEYPHGFDVTTVSSSTTDYTPTNVRPIGPHSTSTDLDTSIAAFIRFTFWTTFGTTWLRWTPYWHTSSGTMETRRRIPWHQQGEWTGLPIQDSPKSLFQLQRYRGNGSFAGASLEILIPRHPQHMVETYRLRPGNLCHSVWQHPWSSKRPF